jgi:hypothetical protein
MTASFTTASDCPSPLPAAPTPTDPAFGETYVPAQPTLVWEFLGIGDYHVRVCSDPYCEAVVRSATVAGVQWTVSPPLDLETQYWWQVKAENACGTGPWSAVYNFNTHQCVELGSPVASDPGVSVGPGDEYTVSWSAVAGAAEYTLQESTDPSFPKATTSAMVVTKRNQSFSHRSRECGGTTYYYRVKARSDCDAGGWSNVVDMTVNPPSIPAAPGTVGLSDDSTSPILDWEDLPDAVSYEVRVCDDTACSPAVASASVDQSQWRVFPQLNENTPYFWQVRAKNACDVVGPWSAPWNFEPGCLLPSSPTLSDPGENVFPGVEYTVSWSAVADATGYRIQEADNPEFINATTFVEDRNTRMAFSHLNTSCTYRRFYYRVVAVNDCGISRISDTVDMAIIGSGLPSAPALIAPTDGSIDVSQTPLLDWSDVADADDYDVWICRDVNCTQVVGEATVLQSSWQVSPALNRGTAYWWQVRAKNACGADLSPRWRLDTVCPAPNAPMVADPGTTVASGDTYTLSWSPIHGATEYFLEEADNPTFSGATVYRTSATSRDLSHDNDSCSMIRYHYRVSAADDCGAGALSTTVDMVVEPADVDEDGICDGEDNCPDTANANQQDTDDDGVGDVCDDCAFDFDSDRDMDGADLADLVQDIRGVSIRNVAHSFGGNCP